MYSYTVCSYIQVMSVYTITIHVHSNFVCAQKHSVPRKAKIMLYVISDVYIEYKVCLLNKYAVENYTIYKLNTRL